MTWPNTPGLAPEPRWTLIPRAIAWMASLALSVGAGSAARGAPPAVAPEHERRGLERQLPGAPAETQGVLSMRVLGVVPLGTDFPAMQGYVLRAREIVVAPGGQVGVHRHDRRPGVAVMLEGVMTERRAPAGTPQPLGPGQVALEDSGVLHWWRNEGQSPARAVVIDIVPNDQP